jgi:hypothetical protein
MNWTEHFQQVSSSKGASFGNDFGMVEPFPVASDTRMPFVEPDKRVFLIPRAAVPSRPAYDVFGAPDDKAALPLSDWVKNVGGAFTVTPHGAPGAPTTVPSSTTTAITTFASTFGVLVTVLGVVIGAFTLGHLQGTHHKRGR